MSASQRSNQDPNPVLVELYHGTNAESIHRGMVAIANTQGEILWSLGRTETLTCIRSALKPMQALALLQSGAFEKANLQDTHLAIACGSHSGEPKHVALVERWLSQLGLSRTDLRCGCSRPLDSDVHRKMMHDHIPATELHHNCSGKHAGFLTLASHLDTDRATYLDPESPMQKTVLTAIESELDQRVPLSDINVDGCSAPNIFAPFQVFACAFGRFVDRNRNDAKAHARQRILHAMQTHPELVSGSKRFSAALSRSTGGKVIGKSGAEGSYLAMLPDAGLSILLKIDDGAKRAAHAAILAILSKIGVLSTATAADLGPKFLSSSGEIIGHFKTTADFESLAPELI